MRKGEKTLGTSLCCFQRAHVHMRATAHRERHTHRHTFGLVHTYCTSSIINTYKPINWRGKKIIRHWFTSMLHKKPENSQIPAEGKHKYWRGFYNTASQLSLCQLCKPFSKSAQPLLMNWTFQTNKAWHSLLLEQGQETATGADRQQSHRFFFFFCSTCQYTSAPLAHSELTRCVTFLRQRDKCIY